MRLIDGNQLKRKAQKVATEAWKMKLTAKVETTLNQFIDWIDAMPTIEPQRKKGKWILVKGSNGKDYHKCSKCLHTQEITGVKNYCAVCGAEMREQDETD